MNGNGAPVFDPLGSFRILEGQTFQIRAFAFDPDNPGFVPRDRTGLGELTPLEGTDPTVTYEASGVPAGAEFDADTGNFLWTPAFADTGEFTVMFTATDDGDGTGAPLSASAELKILVINANRAPVVEPLDPQQLAREETLEYAVAATDPDGNDITLVAENALTGIPLPDFVDFTELDA